MSQNAESSELLTEGKLCYLSSLVCIYPRINLTYESDIFWLLFSDRAKVKRYCTNSKQQAQVGLLTQKTTSRTETFRSG